MVMAQGQYQFFQAKQQYHNRLTHDQTILEWQDESTASLTAMDAYQTYVFRRF